MLVGSTFFFSNLIIRDAAQSILDGSDNQISSDQKEKLDKMEIVFWIFLLSVLGVASFIVIQLISNISNYNYYCTFDPSSRKSTFLLKI
jgi:hypothetical protein